MVWREVLPALEPVADAHQVLPHRHIPPDERAVKEKEQSKRHQNYEERRRKNTYIFAIPVEEKNVRLADGGLRCIPSRSIPISYHGKKVVLGYTPTKNIPPHC